jgi:hypothetical protein
MKLKRLLLSIGIALVLLLGLMAGLRGVPKVQAQDPDPDVHFTGDWDEKSNDSSFEVSIADYNADLTWNSAAGDWNNDWWEGVISATNIYSFVIEVSGDPPYNSWCSDNCDACDRWEPHTFFGSDQYAGIPLGAGRYLFEFSLPKNELGTIGGYGNNLVQCPQKGADAYAYDFSIDIVVINGVDIAPVTDCVPIETLVVTGPVTGTAGQANGFKGTVSPPSDTEPIDWSWEASGEGLAVDDDSESYESLADLTWWYSGTKTVTTTACNCAGCLAVTNTIAITGLSWTPPFSTTFPTPPEFPPDCNCPDPSYFGILEVGHWINWLWCNLKCWILFFLDFLYWLWELLRWVFYTIANTFLFYLWVLTTSAAMQADMYFRTAANWVDESSEALGDLVQALVFDLRDKIHASMTKWADWVDVSFDELGNWLQESVYNVRDWSHITLVDFGEYLNDFFTNLGEGWAGSIINIRDWSYDFLTMVGDFFASWGTNLGDFLAESTYEFRDWTYESLTNLANFVRDSGDNIGNAAEDFVLKIDEWLYDTLTKFGTLLNDWATSLGDYLSAFILAIDAWLYDALTKIGETLNAWIRFIGDVLASFLLFINTVVGGTLAGIYAVVAAQAYVFALLLEVLNTIVTMMHEGLDTIIFLTDLVIGMLTGVKDALDAQTKAELFQGEAFYFWRGLEFFESAVGDTPLAALNSVAIGLMGFRLAMWTAGQVADFMEDISRY